MSRKPVNTLRPDETRDAIWEFIRANRSFMLRDVEAVTRLARESIREYVTGLCNAGYVEKSVVHNGGNAIGKAIVYLLVRDTGVEAPRVRRDGTPVTQGVKRERMWRTMRILSRFSVTDVAVTASDEDCRVSEQDAKSYIFYLCKAGYLTKSSEKKGGGPSSYFFLKTRYTGPKPPQVQRIKQVYDPNLKRVVWSRGVQE